MGTHLNSNQADTVTGEITKILKKESRYGGTYYDVHFRIIPSGNFYRSCVYENCKNFNQWQHLLKVGNILENLQLIETKYHKVFVDADSLPVLSRQASPDELQEKLMSFGNSIRKVKTQLQESLF